LRSTITQFRNHYTLSTLKPRSNTRRDETSYLYRDFTQERDQERPRTLQVVLPNAHYNHGSSQGLRVRSSRNEKENERAAQGDRISYLSYGTTITLHYITLHYSQERPKETTTNRTTSSRSRSPQDQHQPYTLAPQQKLDKIQDKQDTVIVIVPRSNQKLLAPYYPRSLRILKNIFTFREYQLISQY
jgi:hypothetical protein